MRIIALVIAALSGTAMALQGSLNTALGKTVGLLTATLIVHVVGTGVTSVLLFLGLEESKWELFRSAPWYTYLGGLLGVAIIYAVVVSIDRVGVAAATTAIIVGQVSTAALVDHFGWFGLQPISFSLWKGMGIVTIALGAWLLLHK